MAISKFPDRMRSVKLNFSATVLILDLKATIFENLRLLSICFGGNCARAPRLTAACLAPRVHSELQLQNRACKQPAIIIIISASADFVVLGGLIRSC